MDKFFGICFGMILVLIGQNIAISSAREDPSSLDFRKRMIRRLRSEVKYEYFRKWDKELAR